MYIAKTNAVGQLVWQRRYLTGYEGRHANILINSAQDTLYIVLKSSPLTVITYSTDGVLGLQRRLTSLQLPGDPITNSAIDPDGNVYIVALGTALGYVYVSKLSPSLALVYAKQVSPTALYASPYPTIAVDQSGDFYFSILSPLGGSIVAKISTSGTVVAWQRYITDSTNAFFALDMKVSASGYLYTLAYDANNQDRITIGKYSAATGALQWQKRITGLATINGAGWALTIDSNDNCYAVVSILPVSLNFFAFLVKLDSSGNQVWQRKLTSGNVVWSANSICMSGDSTIIVGGQFSMPTGFGATSSGGYWVLNTDGTGLGTWGAVPLGATSEAGIPYATNAGTIAANTPIATVSTEVAISTFATASTTPTNTSTTTTGNLAQLAEIS